MCIIFHSLTILKKLNSLPSSELQMNGNKLPPMPPGVPPLPFPLAFPPQFAMAMGPAVGTKRPAPGKKSNGGTGNPTEEEINSKKERRKEKNRESARACRRRKKEAAQELERQIQMLEVENLKLRLQLKVGEESEEIDRTEEERLMRELEEMIRNGSSEKDVDERIFAYTEKFADYGRDRRSSMEFHLRNVGRLLRPTTTTSVAMRALEGGDEHHSMPEKTKEASVQKQNATRDDSSDGNTTIADEGDDDPTRMSLEPKQLFQYLVDYLEVDERQSKALRDSRKVARELDAALEKSLGMLEELKERLNKCGNVLETELDAVSKILTPKQVAKFLVWVGNNAACMHMLNELWKNEYVKKQNESEEGYFSTDVNANSGEIKRQRDDGNKKLAADAVRSSASS